MSHYLLVIIFTLLMLPGLIGIIIPVLPGVPYMFFVALIFGFVDRFVHLTVTDIVILGLIALFSLVVDYFSGVLGAKYGGATRQALITGVVAFILGTILFPPFGGILGLFLGVFAGQLMHRKDYSGALKAASGSLLGTFLGALANIILGLALVILFVVLAR